MKKLERRLHVPVVHDKDEPYIDRFAASRSSAGAQTFRRQLRKKFVRTGMSPSRHLSVTMYRAASMNKSERSFCPCPGQHNEVGTLARFDKHAKRHPHERSGSADAIMAAGGPDAAVAQDPIRGVGRPGLSGGLLSTSGPASRFGRHGRRRISAFRPVPLSERGRWRHSGRPTRASAPASRPIHIPSSAKPPVTDPGSFPIPSPQAPVPMYLTPVAPPSSGPDPSA